MICGKDDAADCCGLCDYNPFVVIATHERTEITTENIRLLKLQSFVPKIVLVCSLQEEFEYYKTLGVTAILEPNNPLGRKWQVGVSVAYKMGANPLIILGSDDILSKNYIRDSLRKLKEGFHFVGCTSWYSYDTKRNQTYKSEYSNLNKDFPLGSGKVYSRLILDSCKAKLFDVSANSKLDDMGHKQTIKHNSFLFRTPEILAVKGRWKQLNPIEKYMSSRNIKTSVVRVDLESVFGYKP